MCSLGGPNSKHFSQTSKPNKDISLVSFSLLLKLQFHIYWMWMVHTIDKHCLAKRHEFNLKITETTTYLEAPTEVLWTVQKVVTDIHEKNREVEVGKEDLTSQTAPKLLKQDPTNPQTDEWWIWLTRTRSHLWKRRKGSLKSSGSFTILSSTLKLRVEIGKA